MTTQTDKIAAVDPFEISRTVNAPRARVWRAYTEAAQLEQWWGPKGFDIVKVTVDLKPGGTMRYLLRTPDGKDLWGRFIYREIVPEERIVHVTSFSDSGGGLTRNPWDEKWPLEMLTTVTFAEAGGKTTVTVSWIPINADTHEVQAFDAGRKSMDQGWDGTLERLGEYLAAA